MKWQNLGLDLNAQMDLFSALYLNSILGIESTLCEICRIGYL